MSSQSSAPPRRRRSSAALNHSRDEHGCIVTWRGPDGNDHVAHEPGQVKLALRRITDRIPPGGEVRAISTPRTILRDLTELPRRYGGTRGKQARVDAYSVERQLLAKIGRLELLPDDAYPVNQRAS